MKGVWFYSLKDYTASENELAMSLAINPNRRDSAYLLSQLLIRKDKLNEAKVILERIDNLVQDCRIKCSLAVVYIKLGMLKRANLLCDLSLSISSSYYNALLLRAMAKESLRDMAGAASDYDKAIDVSPTPKCYVERAKFLFRTSNYAKAKIDFSTAIEIDRNCYSAYYELGNMLVNLEDYDRAIDNYTSALRIFPHNASCLNNRGNAYMMMSKYSLADLDFTRSLEIKSNNFLTIMNKAKLSHAIRNFLDAYHWYSKAIDIEKRSGNAYISRAGVLYDLGRYSEALTDADKAIKLIPQSPDCYETRAAIQTKLGEHEKAKDDLRVAESLKRQ